MRRRQGLFDGGNWHLHGIAVVLGCLLLQPAVGRTQAAPSQSEATPGAASTRRTIDGTVVNAKTGLPIANANITLSRTRDRTLVAEDITGADGRFSFANLPDGKYSLVGASRGYIASAYEEHVYGSTAIVTGEGLISTGLTLRLIPQAVLYGTITEDSGDPVPRAEISLFHFDTVGSAGKGVLASTVNADEMGNFEIARLAPGSYWFAAQGRPWYATRPHGETGMPANGSLPTARFPLDVAYATTYYPDTTDAAFAVPIAVAGGDRLQVNLTLHPVPAIHVWLQLPQTGVNQGFAPPMLRQELLGTTGNVTAEYNYPPNAADTDTTSRVEISGIAPGHYQLTWDGSAGESSREVSVDLSSNQSVDLSSPAPMADVVGKFVAANGLPSNPLLVLATEKGDHGHRTRVEEDGSFEFHSVEPGTYQLSLFGGGHALVLTRITASGAAIDGHLIKIGSERVTLSAMVSDTDSTVSGFTVLDGKAASGVFVLLFPLKSNTGRGAWQPNQSDSDGSFDFHHVLPGEYTVVAIQEGWSIDWSSRDVLERYVSGGVKVSVPSSSSHIDLSSKVAAQPK